MITLIHGPAELLRAEALAQIRGRIAADAGLAELNTVVFDGRQTRLPDLQFACEAMPFLADRRLVVVEGLLRHLATGRATGARARTASAAARPAAEDAPASEALAPEPVQGALPEPPQQQALLAYLGQVPETTDLVFVEEELLPAGPVLRRLTELQRSGQASIIVCPVPRKNDLPGWIRARAQLRQVALDPSAVADLVEFVGDDLRQLDQELIKLRDFAGGSARRPLTRADVRRLVPATRAANVFELVEALSSGRGAVAARLLVHTLDVDGEQPLRLLALISRQYRLLIMAKTLQAQGVGQTEMARQLGVPDWTVPKLLAPASRYDLATLRGALERILAADEAIKTGRLTDREAMDVLLSELVA